jgi:tRNA (cytosine34-C5)-methyltransferase
MYIHFSDVVRSSFCIFKDGNILFDRILCDVPCSGDGTLRKNPDLWKKWNPGHAFSLQSIQLRIATRGIQLLAPGGLMVYSTCSMNPIENESVVAQLLQTFQGQISLVDVSDQLPGLKTKPGLSKWCVIGKNQEVYHSCEDIPSTLQSTIRPHMFPPSTDVLETLNLHRWSVDILQITLCNHFF